MADGRRIIAVGASAGGIPALLTLVRDLPADFPAPILVVLHIPPESPGVLPDILTRTGLLRATFAQEGDPLENGRVYLAPPDKHLLVDEGRLLTRRGPIENSARPAIDPLFRSVGIAAGAGAVGVVMSGTLSDGVAGLNAIKRCGGTTIVQDPDSADYPELPRNAIAQAEVDRIIPLVELARALDALARAPVGQSPRPPPEVVLEMKFARQEPSSIDAMEKIGARSVLTCPECDGLLWEIEEGALVRYRCHVGHAYGLDSLAESQIETIDRALGTAMRAITEHIQVLNRLSERAKHGNMKLAAKRWDERIKEYERDVEQIRQILIARQFDVDQSR